MESIGTIPASPTSYAKQHKVNKLSAFTSYAFGALEILLVVRFIFKLLGAQVVNAFVSFLYQVTGPFVVIFAGIFGQPPSFGPSIIDVDAIVAACIYGLLWFGLLQLIKTLLD